jgi:hypothetical protein
LHLLFTPSNSSGAQKMATNASFYEKKPLSAPILVAERPVFNVRSAASMTIYSHGPVNPPANFDLF